jgi:cephalosporin hydroxylase
MKFTIDTEARSLHIERAEGPQELPLYGREAFELLSREWVRTGWSLGYYFTFTWLGRPVLQLPEDLVRLQEVLAAVQPDVIIETGIYNGGSLLFHATICEALGKGRVIGIDKHIDEGTRCSLTTHRLAPRIELVEGNSTGAETVARVRSMVRPEETVLVILDSNHTKEHVAGELESYAPFVTPGSCIVAADGIMRDLADVPGGDLSWVNDNPGEAAREFASRHPEFEMNQPAWPFNRSELQKNVTYWPDGWLWRKA